MLNPREICATEQAVPATAQIGAPECRSQGNSGQFRNLLIDSTFKHATPQLERALERPLAGIVRGASSAGKNYIIARVASFFPPETKLEAHYLTPKSLFYLPDDALVHRFVIAGERPRSQDDEQADASKALREMISDGILRCITVEQIDGRLQTVECVKPGPIAYVESTTANRIF